MRLHYSFWLGALAGLSLGSPVVAQKAQSLGQKTIHTAYENFALQQRLLAADRIVCYGSGKNMFTRIPAPAAFLKNRNARIAAPTAKFIVTYNNFTPEAQKAFQYAVDIWASLLKSDVPIYVNASWSKLGANVLGSARPGDLRIGSDGTQKAFGIYPIALAEKIARRPLNRDGNADLAANFNRDGNWYYGLDGNPPANEYDLATVVLHELAHGLGFYGYLDVSTTAAGYDFAGVFDHFLENKSGQKILDQTAFPNGSSKLYQQLTGNSLYFNGPIVEKTSGKAKLYAPSTYQAGSSIYHTDENIYPAGDANSLMTPVVGAAEAIHSPGPFVLAAFKDMEWTTTSVLHTSLQDQEDVKDVVFRARILSDTAIVPSSVRFYYLKGATATASSVFTEVTPTLVAGTTNEYAYTLPAAQVQGTIRYYFQAQDVSGRTFTNPGKNYTGGQVIYRITVGPDNVPPSITHNPPIKVLLTTAADSLPIYAKVTDDRSLTGTGNKRGIDTVYVEYQINGVAKPPIALKYTVQRTDTQDIDSVYTNRILFAANSLKAGDKISYRIVARDLSKNRNQTISPATGFYEVVVVAPQTTARSQYGNTFADATASASDFAGTNFSIAQPAGFTSPAIHTDHPYANGADFKFETDYTYTLLTPIKIKTNPDSATFQFDEIVLVEPGDAGSVFGDAAFYDYVVVEGSKNGGKTWLPFVDGYDSNDNADWLKAYNSSTAPGAPNETNSTAVGTPSLFKTRKFSMQNGARFSAGETVLVRFRLHADQLAHGWGWAVDNLQIQVPPPPPILATEPISAAGAFSVYPNPARSSVRIAAQLDHMGQEAGLTISNVSGQSIRQVSLTVKGAAVDEQIDISQLPTGLYFMHLKSGDTVQTKKVMVVH